MDGKRSRYEIIVAILKVAISGANVTKIVYRANINFKMAQSYLSYLIEQELIFLKERDGKRFYVTTDKGRKFIENYDELKELH